MADLTERVVKLEEWRVHVENRGLDHERRIRDLEAAHLRLTGKITVLAVIGSTLGAALVNWVLKQL